MSLDHGEVVEACSAIDGNLRLILKDKTRVDAARIAIDALDRLRKLYDSNRSVLDPSSFIEMVVSLCAGDPSSLGLTGDTALLIWPGTAGWNHEPKSDL